jgi:hypothetical protein
MFEMTNPFNILAPRRREPVIQKTAKTAGASLSSGSGRLAARRRGSVRSALSFRRLPHDGGNAMLPMTQKQAVRG